MDVLMLNYEFPPVGGGAANANEQLLEQFRRFDDLDVDLVTSSPGNASVQDFSDTITIYKLDVSKNAMHYWTQREILRYSYRAWFKARALHSKHNYDLVHGWFGVPSGVLARFIDAPYLVALRGSDVPGYNERFNTQYVVLKPVIRHVWRRAEAVVANSRGLRDLARETASEDITVIPNGVDITAFTPVGARSDPLSVLCVARLVERKGVRYLLTAVGRTSDVKLTIVGDGDRRDALENVTDSLGLRERVEFVGRVPHDSIHEYYESADLFVLPSLNEGMSNTVLEAMAAGLPIVTTDTGGTEELVDGNGIVVDKRDPDAIADAIETYRDDESRRRAHGERSRVLAEGMSWESVAEQYYELYEDVCETA